MPSSACSGVSRETIDGPGVVSRECASEMAAGARRLFDVDVAVSLTGAAGPEPHGGAEPGTVWLGLDAGDRSHARGYRSTGDRDGSGDGLSRPRWIWCVATSKGWRFRPRTG